MWRLTMRVLIWLVNQFICMFLTVKLLFWQILENRLVVSWIRPTV